MQKGFLTEHTRHLPSAIADFLDTSNFKHRIFTRFHNPGPGSFYDQHLNWHRVSDKPETDIVAELVSYPTDIIDKFTYSGFTNGSLDTLLSEYGVTKTYVCGADTNVCVASMAGDLFDRRIQPVVIADLCASHSGVSYHAAALKNLAKWIGSANIVTSAEILSERIAS